MEEGGNSFLSFFKGITRHSARTIQSSFSHPIARATERRKMSPVHLADRYLIRTPHYQPRHASSTVDIALSSFSLSFSLSSSFYDFCKQQIAETGCNRG